jgi:hypothetical protein
MLTTDSQRASSRIIISKIWLAKLKFSRMFLYTADNYEDLQPIFHADLNTFVALSWL